MSFENVKVGDKVLLPYRELGNAVEAEVTRVTKTQFVAGGKRISKSTEYEVGDRPGSWSNLNRAAMLDDETMERWNREKALLRRKRTVIAAWWTIRDANRNDIEALAALLEKQNDRVQKAMARFEEEGNG